jgi:hypothetical protein
LHWTKIYVLLNSVDLSLCFVIFTLLRFSHCPETIPFGFTNV